jgi:hypothetical protein
MEQPMFVTRLFAVNLVAVTLVASGVLNLTPQPPSTGAGP